MNTTDKIPTVTIALPVYNGEDYLDEALQSLLGQTFGDFELIISDNASTDGTEAICADYAKRDSRIKYDRLTQNLGAAPNYNRVVPMARGRYFKWAAHDDNCLPGFVEACVAALEADPSVVLAFPGAYIIDGDGKRTRVFRDGLDLPSDKASTRFGKYLQRNFIVKRGMCNPVFGVMRTDALRKTRLIQSFVASDRALLGHLSLLGKFAELPEILFERRVHLQTSTLANRNMEALRHWFDASGSTAAKTTRHNNFLALRLIHLRDFSQAIDELIDTPGDRRACRLAMTGALVSNPKWLYRDVKYSLGLKPSASDIMANMRKPETLQ